MLYRVRWPNTWEPEENVTEFSAKENEEADDEVPTPTELTDDNEVLWKVHKILDTHVHKGKVTFKVSFSQLYRVITQKMIKVFLVFCCYHFCCCCSL